MKNLNNAIKVGIFVLITLVVLLVLTVRVGVYRLSKGGSEFYAYFSSIEGLERHAPVRLAGFTVGEVRDIKLVYDNNQTQIQLKLWFEKEARPRVDSVARLAVLGLMGEKYIEISQGSRGAEFLKYGQTMISESPIEMHLLVKKASSIATNLDELLAANKNDLNAAISNLKTTSENMKDFSEDIKLHPWKLLHKTKEKRKRD